MKVITEERLREIKESMPDGHSKLFVHDIITQCQELDTLTVTSLRPMCDAPAGEYILVSYENENDLFPVFSDGRDFLINKYDSIKPSDLSGFIPMPKYEPKKV